MPEAQRLRRLFEYVARRINLSLDVIGMEWRQPIGIGIGIGIGNGNGNGNGNRIGIGIGIGPILEARDVTRVQENDPRAPDHLRQKPLRLAGRLIEFNPDLPG